MPLHPFSEIRDAIALSDFKPRLESILSYIEGNRGSYSAQETSELLAAVRKKIDAFEPKFCESIREIYIVTESPGFSPLVTPIKGEKAHEMCRSARREGITLDEYIESIYHNMAGYRGWGIKTGTAPPEYTGGKLPFGHRKPGVPAELAPPAEEHVETLKVEMDIKEFNRRLREEIDEEVRASEDTEKFQDAGNTAAAIQSQEEAARHLARINALEERIAELQKQRPVASETIEAVFTPAEYKVFQRRVASEKLPFHMISRAGKTYKIVFQIPANSPLIKQWLEKAIEEIRSSKPVMAGRLKGKAAELAPPEIGNTAVMRLGPFDSMHRAMSSTLAAEISYSEYTSTGGNMYALLGGATGMAASTFGAMEFFFLPRTPLYAGYFIKGPAGDSVVIPDVYSVEPNDQVRYVQYRGTFVDLQARTDAGFRFFVPYDSVDSWYKTVRDMRTSVFGVLYQNGKAQMGAFNTEARVLALVGGTTINLNTVSAPTEAETHSVVYEPDAFLAVMYQYLRSGRNEELHISVADQFGITFSWKDHEYGTQYAIFIAHWQNVPDEIGMLPR